ncbi:MAG: HAD-IC family P-type ATPase, partial [Pseudomonadota bacterium]
MSGLWRCWLGSTLAPFAGPAWHALPAATVLTDTGADPDTGLTPKEAAARRLTQGANVLPSQQRQSPLTLFARQFEGLPVMMLGASSVISLGTGGIADGIATLAVVALNGVLGFITEGEAERRIHDLMDASQQQAHPLRDGIILSTPAAALVPGDVIAVEAGHQIPADARLLSRQRLLVDESALTGESLPVEKNADARVNADAPIGERPTMLYAGTIAAEGSGRAVVVATGAETEAARIQMLSRGAARPQSPVESELEDLGAKLALGSLAACGVFLGIGLLRGYPLRMMLKDTLALAVAAVPEGLPMVATSTLSRGVHRMERRGILIRQINVVETLGALQTLCLDKTGTLTENRMSVVTAISSEGQVDVENGRDGFQNARDHGALTPLAEVAALNNDGALRKGVPVSTSPTELALLDFAVTCGVDIDSMRTALPRIGTIERAHGRPWMATVHRVSDGSANNLVTVKGAPEAVLARCSLVQEVDGPKPLTP